MRHVTVPLITFAVGIGIGIGADRAVSHIAKGALSPRADLQPPSAGTETSNTFETEIDGKKVVIVMMTDSK